MRSVEELDVKGKRVFLRVDFNVPLNEKGEIRDDTRIRASLPTITYLLGRGAKLVIASHLGRPRGKVDPKMSLKPVSARLAELIPNKVTQAPDVVGPEVARLKKELGEGEVLVLENLRFAKGETDNDDAFARQLAEDIDVYVNDAFGSCHRAHASVEAIAKFVPVKAAGYLLKKEVDYLQKAVHTPAKPYVAILGGAKVEDKIPVIENLLNKADDILIGGAMAYTFLKAKGEDVGKSLVEDDKKDIALKILAKAAEKKVNVLLPLDHVLATAVEAAAETRVVDGTPFPADMMGVDIGPKTIEAYSKIIAGAKTIFWNGPLGVFEIDKFAVGTVKIAEAVAASGAISIVGGGDSIAAVKKAGVTDKISHISTGGGASLEFLAYETLPGIEALEK
ncbi:MAG TPA: phosphoglycerate kinase [Acidobacteriota bacterium]|nr:phosphoglycerate kinase [Acidobacteriota bacterium]